MGRPVQALSELCRGKKELTADTVPDLERVLGTPADLWMGLEADYRLALARRKRTGYDHGPDHVSSCEMPPAKCVCVILVKLTDNVS